MVSKWGNCLHAVFALSLAGLTLVGHDNAVAQERHKFTTHAAAAQSKYVQQHVIDVGDVPGHYVRIYEIQRTGSEVEFSGVKSKESWSRGYSDYTNSTGSTAGYGVWILEDGSKVFSRYSGISQTVVGADGGKKGTYHGVTQITGGTGKFANIRGFVRDVTKFDIQAGYNELSGEGEYWFEE
jgi:hypothetical protein